MKHSHAEWRDITKQLYAQYSHLTEAHDVEILSKHFIVLPKVFSPKYHANTAYFAEKIVPMVKDASFLEIGAGCGAIAVLAGLNGARVVATDINPAAVENCRLNAEQHDVALDVREGSVFDPIKPDEKFDFILWHHPWNYTDEAVDDILLQAGFDYKYKYLEQFFKDAGQHLAEDGKILLGSGGFARSDLFESFAAQEGYDYKIIDQQKHELEKSGGHATVFMIYEFAPHKKEVT